MRAPYFWKKKSLLAFLLYPFSLLYQLGGWIDKSIKSRNAHSFSKPIISIGNLTVGGSGKTPAAIALGRLLLDKGHNVQFVSRAYKKPKKAKNKAFADYGDEAQLLNEVAPTLVNKSKIDAIDTAIDNGADIIILDDAHQSYYLKKDISILVIDQEIGFGNRFCLPAGPLREAMSRGISRADYILYIGEKNNEIEEYEKPIFYAKKSYTAPKFDQEKPVIAFAGIAYPEKFFNALRSLNIEINNEIDFTDHHIYSEAELEAILSKANGLTIITTKKDWVRLPKPYQDKFLYLDMHLELENPDELYNLIQLKLSQTTSAS